MKKYFLLIFLIPLFVPFLVLAQPGLGNGPYTNTGNNPGNLNAPGYSYTPGQGTSFADIVHGLVGFINTLIPVLTSFALLVFFAGIVQYIRHADNEKARGQGREVITWGLVALFLLVSVWGILKIMQVALFGFAPPTRAPSLALAGYPHTPVVYSQDFATVKR